MYLKYFYKHSLFHKKIFFSCLSSINSNAFKIGWANKFDEVNDTCRARNLSHTDKEQLKLVRKANMMVRRDALAKLFSAEQQIYESELNKKGLCIHRELL